MTKHTYIILTTFISFAANSMELEVTQSNSNADLIKQKLYKAAEQVNSYTNNASIASHKSLINLITLMNNAQQQNISEHDMGAFAFEKEGLAQDYSKVKSAQMPLYFNCLATYNQKKETLPFTIDELNNQFYIDKALIEALGITGTDQSIQDIQDKLILHPAYTNLIDQIKTVQTDDESHRALCIALYKKTQTLLDSALEQCNSATDLDEFYIKAYYAMSPDYYNVYTLINLMTWVKTIETDPFLTILTFNPIESWTGYFQSALDYDVYTSARLKHIIALVYKLIEQYHLKQGDKKIPTGEQYQALLAFKKLNVSLPNTFDTTVFDEDVYGFENFNTLTKNIAGIIKLTDQQLERCIDCYFNEKK